MKMFLTIFLAIVCAGVVLISWQTHVAKERANWDEVAQLGSKNLQASGIICLDNPTQENIAGFNETVKSIRYAAKSGDYEDSKRREMLREVNQAISDVRIGLSDKSPNLVPLLAKED